MGRPSKFSEAEMVAAVQEIEAGARQIDVARRRGVTEQTIMRWRAKYAGMTVSEAKDKKRLEDENRRLRQLVAQYALDNDALKAALGKKW